MDEHPTPILCGSRCRDEVDVDPTGVLSDDGAACHRVVRQQNLVVVPSHLGQRHVDRGDRAEQRVYERLVLRTWHDGFSWGPCHHVAVASVSLAMRWTYQRWKAHTDSSRWLY